MRLPAMPVRSGWDATLNFEKMAKQIPVFVNTLPAQPTDGQEVYFQNEAMATAGYVWHLRYRAASPTGHPWEFVGGSQIIFANFGNPAATPTEAFQFIAGMPTITVPLSGGYVVRTAMSGSWSKAAANIFVGVFAGGVTTQVGAATTAGATFATYVTTEQFFANLSAGEVIKLMILVTSLEGTVTVGAPSMSIVPLRVG